MIDNNDFLIKGLKNLNSKYEMIVKFEDKIILINENLQINKRLFFVSTFVFIFSFMTLLSSFFSTEYNFKFSFLTHISFFSCLTTSYLIFQKLNLKSSLKKAKDQLYGYSNSFKNIKSKHKDNLFRAVFALKSGKILSNDLAVNENMVDSLIQEYFKDKEYKDKNLKFENVMNDNVNILKNY